MALVVNTLSLVGGESLSGGSWHAGLEWGMACFFMLCGLFLLSQVSSLLWALVILAIIYGAMVPASQFHLMSASQERRYQSVQNDSEGRYPPEWKGLDQASVVRQWMAFTLAEPGADGWWDHLRALATEGLWHRERAGYAKGQPARRPIYRQGLEVWLNWLATYLLAALGCLLSLVGCIPAIARVARINAENKLADDDIDRAEQGYHSLADTFTQQGVPATQLRRVLREAHKHRRNKAPIQRDHIATLLPGADPGCIAGIYSDFEIHRHQNFGWDFDEFVSPDRADLEERLIQRFYAGQLTAYERYKTGALPILVAAHRIHSADASTRFWFALRRSYDLLQALGYQCQLKPFTCIDLSGISYQPVLSDDIWTSLETFKGNFYYPGSAWGLLAHEPAEQIPEDAYLAIIHQYIFRPDPRAHEWWIDGTPVDVVQRLGSRLRDAWLTFIDTKLAEVAASQPQVVPNLARMVCAWPFEIASPILERALESGWLSSIADLPETSEWREWLCRFDNSPFGSPKRYVRWY